MKNLNKILPLGFVSMLLLAACTNPFSKTDTTKPVIVPSSTDVVTAVEVVENAEGGAEVNAETFVPTSRYGTSLKCSQLKSPGGREECEMQMNDVVGNMLEREIVATFDIGRCKELPGEAGESCKTRLSETGVTGPVSDEEIALFQEIAGGIFPEVKEGEEPPRYPTYNKARCAELKASGYQAYCEKKITERMERNLFDEIIQSEQSSRCEELTDEQMKNDCKNIF